MLAQRGNTSHKRYCWEHVFWTQSHESLLLIYYREPVTHIIRNMLQHGHYSYANLVHACTIAHERDTPAHYVLRHIKACCQGTLTHIRACEAWSPTAMSAVSFLPNHLGAYTTVVHLGEMIGLSCNLSILQHMSSFHFWLKHSLYTCDFLHHLNMGL